MKPHWTSEVCTRKTKTGWRVDLFHNTYGNNTSPQRFRIYAPQMSEEHAVHWAANSKQGRRCYITSRGDWVLSEVKKKYTLEERKELFPSWASYLRKEWGDLRESLDVQDEIIRVLKLPKSYAASAFPPALT